MLGKTALDSMQMASQDDLHWDTDHLEINETQCHSGMRESQGDGITQFLSVQRASVQSEPSDG